MTPRRTVSFGKPNNVNSPCSLVSDHLMAFCHMATSAIVRKLHIRSFTILNAKVVDNLLSTERDTRSRCSTGSEYLEWKAKPMNEVCQCLVLLRGVLVCDLFRLRYIHAPDFSAQRDQSAYLPAAMRFVRFLAWF